MLTLIFMQKKDSLIKLEKFEDTSDSYSSVSHLFGGELLNIANLR